MRRPRKLPVLYADQVHVSPATEPVKLAREREKSHAAIVISGVGLLSLDGGMSPGIKNRVILEEPAAA